MKRFGRRLTVTVAAVALVAILVPAIALTQRIKPRPDLAVATASEPPDFLARGETFRLTFTVVNQGRRRARRSTTRAHLSQNGQAPSGDDRPLAAARRVPAIPRRGQDTRAVDLTVPADQAPGRYYLLVCADDGDQVRERNEKNNCHLSGQLVRIGATAADRGGPGPAGPAGPPGPPGAKGDPGPASVEFHTFPRTVMSMGEANIDDISTTDDADAEEGSTQKQDVLTVGPFTFRTLCRRPPPHENNQNGDEAKILVYIDEGTMAFEGRQGARANVPAGEGQAGADGASGGEGKHQILAMRRDPDEGFGDDNEQDVAGVSEATTYLVHSSGWELVFEGYAGVDVLGAGEPGRDNEDRCVFGGSATVVDKPAAR